MFSTLGPLHTPFPHGAETGSTCTKVVGSAGAVSTVQPSLLEPQCNRVRLCSVHPGRASAQQAAPHRKQSNCVTSMALQWHQRPGWRSARSLRKPSGAAVQHRRAAAAAVLMGLEPRLRGMVGCRVPYASVDGTQPGDRPFLGWTTRALSGRPAPRPGSADHDTRIQAGNDQHPARPPNEAAFVWDTVSCDRISGAWLERLTRFTVFPR